MCCFCAINAGGLVFSAPSDARRHLTARVVAASAVARVAARTDARHERVGPGVGEACVACETAKCQGRGRRRGDVALAPAEGRSASRRRHNRAGVRAVVVVAQREREEHLRGDAVGEAPLLARDGAGRGAAR